MTALAAVCLLWAGMVLGISFLEAPVKFTAPSLALPVGLDVGRHVFGAFHQVQIGWALVCVVLLLKVRPNLGARISLGIALLILLAQLAWLTPILDERVSQILRREMPPPAPYHLLYIVCEVGKLLALLCCAAACLRGEKTPCQTKNFPA